MLRSTKTMEGYKLAAADGPIGKVKDFLFDETQWTIRWMVADTGDWLPKRKVLISPISLGEPDWNSKLFPVRLTKQEIEDAPGLETDAPVSREYESQWFDQYGWPYYWEGGGIWGGSVYPATLYTRAEKSTAVEKSPEAGPHVVRSIDEVSHYHIEAEDGGIGHVEDFIVDEEPWTIRYLAVDTRNWLPGRKVLLPIETVKSIEWADQKVFLNVEREVVKNSPKYDPFAPINREYEVRLYDYYGRPVYWEA